MMSCSGDISNSGDDSGSAGSTSGCDSVALDREVREVMVVSNFELGHVSMADVHGELHEVGVGIPWAAQEGLSTMVVEQSAPIDRDDDISSSDMFQVQLYMKNELVSSAKKVRDLRSSNGKLPANTEARHVADAEAAKAWATGYELARLRDDFEENERELKAKEREYDELFERIDSIACDAVLQTRAELMKEFKEGKAATWDPDAEIQAWEDVRQAEAAGHETSSDRGLSEEDGSRAQKASERSRDH
ncbi:hypothetical protein ACOSQ2_024070 [Xanthoceras sorbifolium]